MAAFRPYHGETIHLPDPVTRDPFLESIHRAQFKPVPNNFKKLDAADIAQVRANPNSSPWLPQQEKGTRPSCALPYELSVGGALTADRKAFAIHFAAGRELFGKRSAGGAFHVYVPGPSHTDGKGSTRAYAVSPR